MLGATNAAPAVVIALLSAPSQPPHPQAAFLRGVAKESPAAPTARVHRQAAGARHRHVSTVRAHGGVQLLVVAGEQEQGQGAGGWVGQQRVQAGASSEQYAL